jgi:hypothetical protein
VGKIGGRSGQGLCGAGRQGLGAIAQAVAAMVLILAGHALAQAPGAGPTGALSGRLTDLYSRPVDGASLVLRNAATGVEARTVTARNGAYRFSGLFPGEYTLVADSPSMGEGRIAGIFVAAGHESRVQTALALEPNATEALVSPLQVRSSADPRATAGAPIPFVPRSPAENPAVITPSVEAVLRAKAIETLSLRARSTPQSEPPAMPAPAALNLRVPVPKPEKQVESARLALPVSPSPPQSAIAAALSHPPVRALAAAALNRVGFAGASLAMAGVAAARTAAQLREIDPHGLQASVALDPQPGASGPALSGQQLQALPLSGRHWEAFVMDAPMSGRTTDEEARDGASAARSGAGAVSIDGASIRLAFGGRAGGRMRSASLMGPAANEAAIAEVRPHQQNGEAIETDSAQNATVATQTVTTHMGTDQLHGQGFIFDRRNLWGAQNPFTQWVKETAPARPGATPAFTPFPYTAPNHEDRWGFGLGSRIKRQKLFWFAAYDGSLQNDPGVASVRHPDSFFAQPKNDEMQVLSARLGLSSANPVVEGLGAYSGLLESLAGLLGPAARTANQWVGFGRVDWQPAERHRFTLEGTGARWNSPGGGLTRVSETFGSHSFGTSRASEIWLLGRWEAFLTPNLLAVTQGSAGRHIFAESPNTPSAFEQTLNVSAWRQLPQIVVDSRYGFTIGNPSRFGTGSYPDEHLYQVQQAFDWIHAGFLVKAGANWRHNADATTMVRNHTGTYHYSTVENFASDALVFAKYGLADALDRFDQHNCDQRARAWRDSNTQLHGLGYLPCYSYYSQTMGPTDWRLSTNDLAAYATAQWQPAKRFVLSAALRWEQEYFPPPIALVDNPALPLTQRIPSPGNQWAPRVSFAWGSGESRWPIVRGGYGMYYARTQNSVLETALTQTGSFKGDLNFFMRPTDNLEGGGAPPFPYVLAGEPASVVKPGAVEFSGTFKNPEIHQAEVAIQETLPGHVQVVASAVLSLARRLPVTMDTNFDPETNPRTITYAVVDALGAGPIKKPQITVPFFASWPTSWPSPGSTAGGRLNGSYQQITELISRANSTYEAAMLRVSRLTRRGVGFHARYTYGHAMDWNPNESTLINGSSVLDPMDFRQEYGTSNLDLRHSASAMLIWQAPWKLKGLEGRIANGWMVSGTGQLHSGLPFTMRTGGSIPGEFNTTGAAIVGLGPSINGYGGDNRVYGVGRNTYRYPFTWKADVRLGKKFNLGQMRELELMAESFNLFNHQNVTRLETTGYTIAPGGSAGALPTLNFLTGLKTGQTEFGKPLDVNATDYFRPRQFDFGMRVRF